MGTDNELFAIYFDVDVHIGGVFDILVGDDEGFCGNAVTEDFVNACGIVEVGFVTEGAGKIFKVTEVVVPFTS